MLLDEREFDVAVIGGGASGALVAAHFKRAGGPQQRLALIEARSRCRGVAYGSGFLGHLLNVPASRMSAFADEPGHFAAWLSARVPDAGPATFAPRTLYGEYLEELVHAEPPAAPEHVDIEGTAVRLTRHEGRWLVHLRDGQSLRTRNAILALGNLPPADPVRFTYAPPEGYIADPWDSRATQGLASGEAVLVLGTGLTMVDLALTLRAEGHRGTLYALSRRGRVPRAQRSYWPRPSCQRPDEGSTPAQCMRWVRDEVDAAQREGYDWRAVIDGVRNHTASIWAGWSVAQRQSFLRHARGLWDQHRHRVAPEVHAAIESLRSEGALRLLAGRVLAISESPGGLAVSWRARGETDAQTMNVVRVINCTGPATDYGRVEHSLVAQLRAVGWLSPDPLGLGIETEEDGGLIDRNGRRVPGLFTLGPPCRPRRWESTAIPEIRVQAAALARQLASTRVRQRERVAL